MQNLNISQQVNNLRHSKTLPVFLGYHKLHAQLHFKGKQKYEYICYAEV